ncbi:DUF5305 domain-containing protein [Halobacterium bonnevillei]|uniref:DUF5305 domain-containing protein n=1 Tax=Halobacterium bonnevillei TaxID=2692200 RepID=A0A6B0SEX6_9EURY|nr:DUF5305 domain-containing protein [Halobacterium bonnevillei]MXR20108.1 hypothetical protein [Halobacterium bonnevillei]
MGRGTGWVRVRAIASSWFPVLVVALLAAAAVGGWATMTAHATPGTSEQQSEQAHWTVTGEFDHSATVTRENPVFDRGTVLSDRQTYYLTVAPVLDGEFTAEYASVEATDADLSVDAELVVQEVGEDVVYWTERRQLATTDTTVASGEQRTVSFAVNVSDVADRRSEIRDGLGQTPGDLETFVAMAVTAEGTADGGPAELSFTQRLPLSIDGDTYSVGSPGRTSETLTTTETVQVERSYGPLWSVGGPVLFLVAGGGLVALAFGRRRGLLELSADERSRLTFQQDRATFDEWIVAVRLPDAVHDLPRADAESLADLVDFAIDTNAGVVEDPDTGTFYAVGDEVLVAFEPPEFDDEPSGQRRPADVSEGAGETEQTADSDAVEPPADDKADVPGADRD